MSKTRVAVLRGGPSAEYDVSMKTGAAVINALDSARYEAVDVIVTKNGEWLVGGYVRYPEHILSTIDVVFVALHGTYGEDGTVQRLLDQYGVPYTGSNAYASRIAMHKAFTKEHLKGTSITTPRHMVVRCDSGTPLYSIANSIAEVFGPEYVIKPISSGSSVGVQIITNKTQLLQALRNTRSEYDEVLVEEYIRGREATCGVIEAFRGSSLYALPVIEIVPPPTSTHFDTAVKYDGSTQELCPGRFSTTEKKAIEQAALDVHRALGLSQYSRSDFIVGKDGTIHFLEVNTLPGLTPESLFPKAIDAVGSSYNAFIDHLITHARKRHH